MIRRLALAVAALSACAKSGPAPDVGVVPVSDQIAFGTGSKRSVDRTAETVGVTSAIAAPADQVYAALVSVYRDLKIPLADASPTQRSLGSQAWKVRRSIGGVAMQKYVDCGDQLGQPNAETFDLVLSITSFVAPGADGRSTITTRLSGVGSDPSRGQGNQMSCGTLGALEARIAQMVKAQVAK